MFYKDLEDRKRAVIEYIKKNPKATYKELRKRLKTHPERIFKNGMAEAFKEARINPPRTFERKNLEERKKRIIKFIKENPKTSSFKIKRELKINVPSTFKSIKEAYKTAGVEYIRKDSYDRPADEKREEIIRIIRENPYITLTELIAKTKIKNPYKLFKNFADIYKKADIKIKTPSEKIRNRKTKQVINFIKMNPLATQREINKACKTKIQEILKEGIFEAYQKAGVDYPFERRKIHGTALNDIKKRAKDFEEEIAIKLSGYGKVNRLVKTKRGVADIILERNNKKIIIEIKDYQLKDISISQIKQLNKYLEDCDSNTGILICHNKPKRDRFLIDKNQIFILEEQELNKLPLIIDGRVV